MRATLLLAFLLSGFCTRAVDHFVSLAGGHVPPFTNWFDAATNIQAAVDVASVGETVWVTNGVYTTGGRVMAGDLTNRVVLDKAISLRSVNGAMMTTIRGAWDFLTTNGPGAVRCVWMTNGASIEGFTITGGATRITFNSDALGSGGGVFATSQSATVSRCVIATNAASYAGGGCYFAYVTESKILGNKSIGTGNGATGRGGGASASAVFRCLIAGNEATSTGGGILTASPFVANCTIVMNRAPRANSGGGIQGVAMTNCIVYFNSQATAGADANLSSFATFSCSPRLISGPGNITNDPALVDGIHLSFTSPCRSTGTNMVAGSDIDGESWSNPPAMGCDEVWEAGITGPLAVTAFAQWPEVAERGIMQLTGSVTGLASMVNWDYGDGSVLTNGSFLTSHVWTNAGDYIVTFTAFNADNTNGVTTNLQVHVAALQQPTLSPTVFSGPSFFTLNFSGQAGITYVLERATNLVPPVTWQSRGSVFSTGSVASISDLSVTNAMGFYRLRFP